MHINVCGQNTISAINIDSDKQQKEKPKQAANETKNSIAKIYNQNMQSMSDKANNVRFVIEYL